ncbi:GNAT family N-acetyltransferase [Mobilitalea sibirica]|uniref:GNAT family N-acetyltransferase n=1 Tax=Mobilitalea sibirica TaxID=1462919 RepID=A0A8J7KUK2_9FIRM|nr:GNAT family N-acetyltransferase [Mobilitalea sibirica]MBH1942576.1 GNAT family N-acetyltransferase [Mobilitalea sibirica]
MLEHKGTMSIETDRLLLRRFLQSDAKSMFHNWTNDEDVCKYMRWPKHKNINETRDIIAGWINSYNKLSFYLWAITLKESDELVGSIVLFVVNENDHSGDVGYCLGKRYWGKGIATEALKAVLNYAFFKINFNRIETYHSINNPASGKVMQKCGMVFEGLAKQKYKSTIGYEDCNMYAILKENFKLK